MTQKELKEYLIKEENHVLKGWDFSYLNRRWEQEVLPWNYKEIVLKHLSNEFNILDMGTGGGEFLLTLNHPYEKTSVTEAYEPNIQLCEQTLAPKGIKVYPVLQDDILLGVPSNHYDLVINRHESYNESEVRRVLKQGSVFVTQQVGAFNNKDLATFFDANHKDQFPHMTLDQCLDRLRKEGFEILYAKEYFPKIKFFDLGSIAFFAKVISWEFINFSVEETFDKFLELDKIIKDNGFIESTEHRFIIVCRKKRIRIKRSLK